MSRPLRYLAMLVVPAAIASLLSSSRADARVPGQCEPTATGLTQPRDEVFTVPDCKSIPGQVYVYCDLCHRIVACKGTAAWCEHEK